MVEPANNIEIDYKKFEETHLVPGILVPLKETSNYMKVLSPYFNSLGQKGCLSKAYTQQGFNLIFLSEKLLQEWENKLTFEKEPKKELADPEGVSKRFMELDSVKKFIEENLSTWPKLEKIISTWPVNLKNIISDGACTITIQKVTLGYEDLSYVEVMKKILPESVTPPTSYETIGTLAHLNLRANQLPYKKIIGKVLLEKNKGLKTVVNKVSGLSNVFRTPELEILAGDDNYITEVKEGKSFFELSYEKGMLNIYRIHIIVGLIFIMI
jgi:hypothetical protein